MKDILKRRQKRILWDHGTSDAVGMRYSPTFPVVNHEKHIKGGASFGVHLDMAMLLFDVYIMGISNSFWAAKYAISFIRDHQGIKDLL